MEEEALMSTMKLLSPVDVGSHRLKNRMVMAPLTRLRAGARQVPRPMSAVYYAQRAGAGLIISEATDISSQAHGYANAPGIYTEEHVGAWRNVTDAVHARKGIIFLQLWHTGRISHPSLHGGELPVAPSAIAAEGHAITYEGPQPFVTPRALRSDEIGGIVEQYRQAALNAKEAGFDGVEIHSANGYLLDQFLRDGSNRRTDDYGGSIPNRARLLLEVTGAAVSVWGAGKVGVRLSPAGTFNSMFDSNPQALFSFVLSRLNEIPLAYVHLIERRQDAPDDFTPPDGLGAADLRKLFDGTIISAGGYERESAEEAIRNGVTDLVAFGRLFISNPDLPRRFELDAPLNPYDRATFYGGDEHGYTDYPAMDASFASETSAQLV